MNKKSVTVVTGAVVLGLGVVGCSEGSGRAYSYEVSGTVEAAHVDYGCGDDLVLDPAAFTVGKSKPGKTKKDSGASDSSGSGKAKDGGRGATTSTPPKKVAPASKAPSKTPVGKVPAKPSGAELPDKPDAPERVTEVKPPKYKSKQKGCREEYELFVRNRDGLFEQDVRKVDYDKCSDKARESFPSCTKN